uniref:Ig-like domain-containing protein n=1 Tax=Oncorhynchus kisutch TaxID=8019 RepID=A0A8C7JF54_ONCKI
MSTKAVARYFNVNFSTISHLKYNFREFGCTSKRPHNRTWADVPPKDQYGLKGGSVCLAVEKPPEEIKGFSWKVNSTVIVDDKEISPKYKEKVDYNPVNHTLCIKNLTDTDSGIYIANTKKIDWTDSTSSYKLKVLEAVPIPAMQVTYYNLSTGLCNITVNCSGWMFSVCDGGQCPLYQDSLSVSEVNITVSSGNGFIQCIVNNHVSTEAKSQRMKDTCRFNELPPTSCAFVYHYKKSTKF